MINVILCGGNGTRLWPVSRKMYPKQFNKLIGDRTLFQETVHRNRQYCRETLVVSNEEQYFLCLDQLRELQVANYQFILEPIGRNTAPAVALACLGLDPEELIFVTPADHVISNLQGYTQAIAEARILARDNHIVTFGITPDYPETGFGYIESRGHDVISFKEKPDKAQALEYIQQGNFFWNSGMFLFKAGVIAEELQKYAPEIYEGSQKALGKAYGKGYKKIPLEDMQRIPADSIDYAVMEKSNKVKVVAASMGWSDLGSFEALYEKLPKDNHSNAATTPNHINIESQGNLLFVRDKTVVTIGIEDLIIVDTADALLISKKGDSQKVKEAVGILENQLSELVNVHQNAFRPWGSYTVLEEMERFKMKRIVVKPGKRLSLQKHYHRNEHWVVVSGTARITIEDEEKIVRTNESTYIPMGKLHRLENPGKIDLVLIEVQVGEYLGEDDIVRVDDDYQRNENENKGEA
ncbi:MAG: mannose-1-phosphate guanylyltransferase/mannose-6-phosphate isomerase [Desulfitobacterium sp.]